jgi:hypothetical protein
MGQLNVTHADVQPAASMGQFRAIPPWPGYPNRLEQVTPEQSAYLGHRYGIDTPRYVTLSGWGELIPVTEQDIAEGVWPLLEVLPITV